MVEARMVYRAGGEIVVWLRPPRPLEPGEVIGSIRQWAEDLDESRGRVERALCELRRPAPDGKSYLTVLEQHARHGTVHRVERYPEDWGHSSRRQDKSEGDSSRRQDKSGGDLSQKGPYSSRKGGDSTRRHDERASIRPASEPPFNRVMTNNPLGGGTGREPLGGSAPADSNGSLEAVLEEVKRVGWPETVDGAISVAERVAAAAGRRMYDVLGLLCDARGAPGGRRFEQFQQTVSRGDEATPDGLTKAEHLLRGSAEPSTGR